MSNGHQIITFQLQNVSQSSTIKTCYLPEEERIFFCGILLFNAENLYRSHNGFIILTLVTIYGRKVDQEGMYRENGLNREIRKI